MKTRKKFFDNTSGAAAGPQPAAPPGNQATQVTVKDDLGRPMIFTQYTDPAGEIRLADPSGYVYKMENGKPMPMGGARLPLSPDNKPVIPGTPPAGVGGTVRPAGAGGISVTQAGLGPEGTAAAGSDFAYRLATGQNISTANGDMSPRDILTAQGNQGLPVGLSFKDTLDNHRAKSLAIGTAAPTHKEALAAAQGLAGGDAADASFGRARTAWDTAAHSGASDFGAAEGSARSLYNAGQGMTGDIDNLRAAAAGTVPSAAAIQQRVGIGDAINSQQAMAAGARGGNVAAAMRTAAGAGSSIQSRGIADASALRANEQATARAALTQAQVGQGSLFQGASGAYTGIGSATAGRDAGVATGQTNMGTAGLSSKVAGSQQLGAGADRELNAAQLQAAREADDRAMYYNNYLQWLNTLNGNSASVIQGNTAREVAGTQARAQETGALVGAGGALVGGIIGAV